MIRVQWSAAPPGKHRTATAQQLFLCQQRNPLQAWLLHSRTKLTVTGPCTGCTFDSSTNISLTCTAQPMHGTGDHPHARLRHTYAVELLHGAAVGRWLAHVFTKGLELILCQEFTAFDLLNPFVQLNHALVVDVLLLLLFCCFFLLR